MSAERPSTLTEIEERLLAFQRECEKACDGDACGGATEGCLPCSGWALTDDLAGAIDDLKDRISEAESAVKGLA